MMPEINGLELTRLVKANPNWFETRIVLFSCNSEPEFRKRALELGALDYLPKTDGANSIVARVYEILSPQAKEPLPLAGHPSSEQNPGESALGEQLRALSRSLADMLHLAQMDKDIPSTTQYALDSANRIAEDISRLVRSVEEESREPSSTENRPKAAS